MRKFLLIGLPVALFFIFISCDKNPDIIYTGSPQEEFSAAEKALILSGDADSLMQLMNFFVFSDSLVLRTKCTNVGLSDTTTLFHLIDRMYSTVRDPGHPGVGIAAPQVGICRNIVWIQRYDKGTITNHPFEVYLNTRITRYSDTTKFKADGCLSIPGISDNSRRAIWVDVEYDLPSGSHFSERISHEYTAHIFQHEIDHLNGILFVDRLY